MDVQAWAAPLEKGWEKVASTVSEHKYLSAAVAAGAVVASGVALSTALTRKRTSAAGRSVKEIKSNGQTKFSSIDLSGGSIEKQQVKAAFEGYSASYEKDDGKGELGIKDRTKTGELVDTFYNLVTDLYEWGWGTSFHFSPNLPGKNEAASEAAHEARIAAILGLTPGMRVLDAGCGIGGPMRTIAAASGARVTGVTINDYQVQRAKYHNERLGLQSLCEVVQGDFTALPFEPNTFDGAYAIEATCHASKLEDPFGQIYKALRPGARFVSYEWVTTKMFDPNNEEHKSIVDMINYGNGLPTMRTYKEAEAAGKAVGFKLLQSIDLATANPLCSPWYDRLQLNRFVFRGINQSIVNVLSFLGITPRGMDQVHAMLLDTVDALVAGGKTGIFTPMHMLVFEKPLDG